MDELNKILVNLPENVSLNTPSQKISVFNFVNQIDLLLTSWSSIAEDLGLLGVQSMPISSYFINYPISISGFENKKKNISEKLMRKLRIKLII